MFDWKVWLEDRAAHRGPVDQHFDEAIAWVTRGSGADHRRSRDPDKALELGPGHSPEIGDALRAAGIHVAQADLHPEMPGVVDLTSHWSGSYRELPFEFETFDAVLAREVMEHVDDIYQMVSEIHQVLKVGGRFWFSTPFIFPLHDYDTGDYWRLSPRAWEWLLPHTGFSSWEVSAPAQRRLWKSWQYPITVIGWAQR